MVENGAEIEGNASCYYNSLSTAVENSASLVLVPNNSQEGNIKAMRPGVGSEDFTFQRNTTATRVNKDGLIESVGNNVPRLDYTNGDCPEILIEPQRTNLWEYSEPSENVLGMTNDTTAGINNWGIGLNGVVTIPSTGNDNRFLNGNNINLETTYTFSLICRLSNGQEPIIGVGNVSGFDLNIVIGGDNATENSINKINIKNDLWFITGSLTSTSNVSITGFRKRQSQSPNTVEISAFMIVEGEVNLQPYSYIPTNGSIATRNADVVTLSNAQDLIGQQEGSVYVEFERSAITEGITNVFSLSNETIPNQFNAINLSKQNGNNNFQLTVNKNGNNMFNSILFNSAPYNKLAIIYGNNEFKVFLNSVLIQTRVYTEELPLLQKISLLSRINPFSGFNIDRYYGSSFKQFSLFKTALTDQEAINLTTL